MYSYIHIWKDPHLFLYVYIYTYTYGETPTLPSTRQKSCLGGYRIVLPVGDIHFYAWHPPKHGAPHQQTLPFWHGDRDMGLFDSISGNEHKVK